MDALDSVIVTRARVVAHWGADEDGYELFAVSGSGEAYRIAMNDVGLRLKAQILSAAGLCYPSARLPWPHYLIRDPRLLRLEGLDRRSPTGDRELALTSFRAEDGALSEERHRLQQPVI